MSFDAASVRSQFPALHQKADDSTIPVFFDNPGGTQVPQAVIDAVTNYYTHMNANHGGAFATSQRSDAMVRQVREQMADFVNAPQTEEIVFGPNMTTLNFSLSRALGKTLSPGDEIVVTRMDHDGNIAPWLRIAEDYGLDVHWVDINTSDCTLDMDSLEAALTDRTRVVATVHASNAVGTINPVERIAEMAHTAGALYVVDAVQSAPHVPIDVQAIGCDFLLCSAYKFFGPHAGLLWGRYELMAKLPVYKVRPAVDIPPDRWETGTPSFETVAGIGATLDYLAALGRRAGPDYAARFPHFAGRRLELKMAMEFVGDYERELVEHLIRALQAIPGVYVAGITDPARFHERVPTVAFIMDGHTPQDIAAYLGGQHIYVWDGNYYAQELMERLGYGVPGMVRVGLAHYNTHEEIDRLAAALRAL